MKNQILKILLSMIIFAIVGIIYEICYERIVILYHDNAFVLDTLIPIIYVLLSCTAVTVCCEKLWNFNGRLKLIKKLILTFIGIGVSYAAFYNFAAILFAITMNKMG